MKQAVLAGTLAATLMVGGAIAQADPSIQGAIAPLLYEEPLSLY
jgi:hypothetical protein